MGKVDSARVEDAIRKGVEYLRKQAPFQQKTVVFTSSHTDHELVLLTFLHAGITETDADVQSLIKEVMAKKPETTYAVSLKAMCLRELDRARYQAHLAECAQFLIDNQCKNGQWTYGGSLSVPGLPPEPADVATGPVRPADKSEAPIRKKIPIRKLKEGPAIGDNSNAQYASLGLRACFDAGIVLPKESLERARKFWRDAMMAEEEKGKTSGRAGGWSYDKGEAVRIPYAAMTAGAIGSLAIYDRMLGLDWNKDPDVRAGLNWLGNHFSVTENVGVGKWPGYHEKWMQYYYLYALERAGMLLGKAQIGTHEWYPEGAAVILSAQQADGSWAASAPAEMNDTAVWNACWAILFLNRATRPLVPSEDRYIKKGDDGNK